MRGARSRPRALFVALPSAGPSLALYRPRPLSLRSKCSADHRIVLEALGPPCSAPHPRSTLCDGAQQTSDTPYLPLPRRPAPLLTFARRIFPPSLPLSFCVLPTVLALLAAGLCVASANINGPSPIFGRPSTKQAYKLAAPLREPTAVPSVLSLRGGAEKRVYKFGAFAALGEHCFVCRGFIATCRGCFAFATPNTSMIGSASDIGVLVCANAGKLGTDGDQSMRNLLGGKVAHTPSSCSRLDVSSC